MKRAVFRVFHIFTSIAAAMSILGYKVLHDDEGPAIADLYGAYSKQEITEDELHTELGKRGFNCSFMYNGYTWAARQEDVKVILTTRDPEQWVDSWLTVADGIDVFGRPPFIWIPSIRDMMPVLTDLYKEIPTGGHPEGYLDRETLVRGYNVHIANVRNAVPPERLLEYNVKQGWEPLCHFLNIQEVPNIAFPHINDRLKVQAVMMTLRAVTYIWPLFLVTPLLLVAWLLFRHHRGKLKVE